MQDVLVLNLDQTDRDMLRSYQKYRTRIRQVVRDNHGSGKSPKIRFLQSANAETCYQAIRNTKRIVHLSGHGHVLGRIQAKNRTGSLTHEFRLKDFANLIDWDGSKLDLDCIILDSCYSSGILWRNQLRRLVQPEKKLIVIGSAFALPFNEADFFFPKFYEFLFDEPMSRQKSTRLQHIRDAFNFAQDSYRQKFGKYSRLRIMEFNG